MSHTVVGLFSDMSQAQSAVERLKAKGVSSDSIDVARKQGQRDRVKDEPGDNQEWVGTNKINDNNLTRFFKSLFGGSDDIPDHYSRITDTHEAIITVHATSQNQAEQVADVLDECGAIDINDQDRLSDKDALTRQSISDQERATEAKQGRRSLIVGRTLDNDFRLRDEPNLPEDEGRDRNITGTSNL